MALTTITSDFTLKAILTFCLATVAPHVALMIFMLMLIGTDFLTGMYASYRKKCEITSSRLKKTIEKFSLYSIAVICAIFFEAIFLPQIPLTKIVAGFISSVELLSIYENIRKICGVDIGGFIKQYLKKFIPTKKR